MSNKIIEIGKQLLSETNLEQVLTFAIDKAIENTGAERGLVILFGADEKIIFEIARNLNQADIEDPKFEISHSIIASVKKNAKAICLQNALEDPNFSKQESVYRLKILSVICLPLLHENELFGVVYLDNRTVAGSFEKEAYEFAQEFVDFISIAAYSALEKKKLQNRVGELESELRANYHLDAIIGHDPKMVKLLELVSKIADTSATVLIHGESGTGKELIAKAIHYNSARKNNRFLPINCAALPETLLESELFGHVKGAFTGAIKDKKGLFEHAKGGTIFLDEISEMSIAMQAKLLRILQSGEYSKIGSTEIEYADVRLIAASSKNIKIMVAEKKFREDLFYRINVIGLELPPLRNRKSDIPVLVEHFLKIFQNQNKKSDLRISEKADILLQSYNYPGNIRELENIIQRAVILVTDNLIEPIHLPLELQYLDQSGKTFSNVKKISFKTAKQNAIEKFEKEFLTNCLRIAHGNISKAAQIADMYFPNFYEKIQKYSLNPASFKK